MKNMFVISALILAGCSSQSITPISGGQYVATYTDKTLGADGSSVVSKVMANAKARCGDKEIKVINLSNTGRMIGSFPEATLVFECN